MVSLRTLAAHLEKAPSISVPIIAPLQDETFVFVVVMSFTLFVDLLPIGKMGASR
jgi:hypothetical protein